MKLLLNYWFTIATFLIMSTTYSFGYERTLIGLNSNGDDAVTQTPVIDNISKTIFSSSETVRINGSNFGDEQGNSYVTFAGKAAEEYLLWGDKSIVVYVPEEIQSGELAVWVNGVKSNGVQYTFQDKFKLLKTVTVKAGTFMMGDDDSDEFDNQPAHQVTITNDFEISVNEITQAEWKLVMDGSNPSHPNDTGDSKPVQQVTFRRALEFCNRLSKLEGLSEAYELGASEIKWKNESNGYRLPTEAEWEYAARAGITDNYTNEEIMGIAVVSENSNNRISEVMQKMPNAWGIYDMLGNVSEWCWDYYDSDYYSVSTRINPTGPASSDFGDRIIRGGAFNNGAERCQPNIRGSFPAGDNNYNFSLGFRVVRNKTGMNVREDKTFDNIRVNPNPAGDYVEIAIPPLERGLGDVAPVVKVFNVLGVEVMTASIHPMTQSHRMNIESLPPGVYFVQIGNRVGRFVKM